MRRANKAGSVFKVCGKRRKPWRARVTVGYRVDENGEVKQVVKDLGYFQTRQEAEVALKSYADNPYDLDTKNITLKDVYDEWSKGYFKTIEDSSIRSVTSAFAYMHSLHNRRIRDIRVPQLKKCLEEAYVIERQGKNKGEKKMASASTKARMKSVMNLMFMYAVEHEYVETNYAKNFNLPEEIRKDCINDKKEVVIFSNEEIEKLWGSVSEVRFADMVLIGIYSGWRPRELATLKVENIDLDKGFMHGGSKTDAGKNRIVPIHSVIKELVEKRYNDAIRRGSAYLFNDREG